MLFGGPRNSQAFREPECQRISEKPPAILIQCEINPFHTFISCSFNIGFNVVLSIIREGL
jgi:hypothetical protein